MRAVMVARPEWIDPQKFGVIVAANRGFDANVFPKEAEAIAWLNERQSAMQDSFERTNSQLTSGGDLPERV